MRRILLTLFLALILPAASFAAESVPGTACTQTNAWRMAGGPENSGIVNGMFCNGTTWTGVINLQSSGNVGIGTTNPSALLSLGAHTSDNNFMVYDDGNIYDSQGITTQSYEMRFFGDNGNGNNDYASNMTFGFLSNTGVFQERVRFTGTGSVGIGTTNPTAALDVVGNIQYTGALIDISDRRLKHDIRPLSPQLGKLMKLQPVSFVMNSGSARTELGLIAQDVQPVYPDLVHVDPTGMRSMNYVGLISPMIAAIKEQQAEIRELWAGMAIAIIAAFLACFGRWRSRSRPA